MTLTLLRRWWPLVAVAGLLALASLAAAHSSVGLDRVEPPADLVPTVRVEPRSEATVGANGPVDSGPTGGADIPGWIRWVATGLCGLAVLAVIGAVLWALIRDLLRRRAVLPSGRGPGRSAGQTADDVVAALDAGLVDLSDADADPRRAVIACWVRLEQAAAAAGVTRQPGDTPTDLVTRLLTGGPAVSADVLADFAGVYREARYATHTVDERMRAQARSALQRLRTELTAGVAR